MPGKVAATDQAPPNDATGLGCSILMGAIGLAGPLLVYLGVNDYLLPILLLSDGDGTAFDESLQSTVSGVLITLLGLLIWVGPAVLFAYPLLLKAIRDFRLEQTTGRMVKIEVVDLKVPRRGFANASEALRTKIIHRSLFELEYNVGISKHREKLVVRDSTSRSDAERAVRLMLLRCPLEQEVPVWYDPKGLLPPSVSHATFGNAFRMFALLSIYPLLFAVLPVFNTVKIIRRKKPGDVDSRSAEPTSAGHGLEARVLFMFEDSWNHYRRPRGLPTRKSSEKLGSRSTESMPLPEA